VSGPRIILDTFVGKNLLLEQVLIPRVERACDQDQAVAL